MPPFSRHPMFGPIPPVSKLPVAETAFCWREARHYELFAHVLASAARVGLLVLPCHAGCCVRRLAAQGGPIGGLATRGQARSGHFATLEEAGTGLEGWPPTSV